MEVVQFIYPETTVQIRIFLSTRDQMTHQTHREPSLRHYFSPGVPVRRWDRVGGVTPGTPDDRVAEPDTTHLRDVRPTGPEEGGSRESGTTTLTYP